MADQWFYRMFGQDFGPVAFDELKSLAELGSIASDDEVRNAGSSDWVTAGSIGELGLSSGGSATLSARAVMTAPTASSSPAGADDWYCKAFGQELGPLPLEEIVTYAEQGQLSADDEVRLGATGKWRRVGSIGRLMAVLPYQGPSTSESKPPSKPVAQPAPADADVTPVLTATTATAGSTSTASTSTAATAQNLVAAASAANADLVQAQAAYVTADQSAKGLVAWALAPNVDPAWWGWIGGAEYGPMGFVQIYELSMTGRIQPTDFVKNGMYGQYAPVANVPGLVSAITMMASAREALGAAQAKAAAAAANVAAASVAAVETAKPPVPKETAVTAAAAVKEPHLSKEQLATVEPNKPTTASMPVVPKDMPAKPAAVPASAAMSEEVRRPVVPSEPRPAPSSYGSNSSVSAAAKSRPVSIPSKSAGKNSKSSGISLDAVMGNPTAIAGIAAVAVLLLLVGGFYLMPISSGKDVERYHVIKKVLDDVRSARKSGSKDFTALTAEAKKVSEEITMALKNAASNRYPAKQALLWAARDELPRMMNGDLSKESSSERNLENRLKEAAVSLGIK